MCVRRLNNRSNANGRNNLNNNNGRLIGITKATAKTTLFMKTYDHLWEALCSYDNLEKAYKKARKHKTLKPYVIEFEKNLRENLLLLRSELLLHCYRPKPLVDFIVHDPKTRKISKSDFRDRIVHHALCNIIEPIFDKAFIYDSYANRIGKGTLKAVQRFDLFKRKASRNDTLTCYVLKADIRRYFENISHRTLMQIIQKKIADKRVLWLIKTILTNYTASQPGKGMPLGNLTSQFFANVYLNELDCLVKNEIRAEYYIRYVDDFVILYTDKNLLQDYALRINMFLKENLQVEIHPDKSKVITLDRGIGFLGFRVFYNHRLLKKSNLRKMRSRLQSLKKEYNKGLMCYDEVYASIEGWMAYAGHANTYNLKRGIARQIEKDFPNELSTKEINKIYKESMGTPCYLAKA